MFWLNPSPSPSPPTTLIRCRRCGRELGRSMGDRLHIGDHVVVRRAVSLECKCGAARKWRPWVDGNQNHHSRKPGLNNPRNVAELVLSN